MLTAGRPLERLPRSGSPSVGRGSPGGSRADMRAGRRHPRELSRQCRRVPLTSATASDRGRRRSQVADDGAYGDRSGEAAARPPRRGRCGDGTALTGAQALELFDAQLASRHLDLAARWLRSFGEGFYTIGSAGHEGNAAVAAALRPTDPALLHYRSGAFYCRRAMEVAAVAPEAGTPDDDPAAALTPPATCCGGRRLRPRPARRGPAQGLRPTRRWPSSRRTSTIAWHLPRAVGVGFADRTAAPAGPPADATCAGGTGRARGAWPADAIVVCSFGDASVNHAVAHAAFNTAGWCDHSGVRLPVLFVCEDNGLGHQACARPQGWVAAVLRTRPGLRYFAADGCDLAATYDAAIEAAGWVRRQRRPAVLHLRIVRLMGHAGADAEVGYRSAGEIAGRPGPRPAGGHRHGCWSRPGWSPPRSAGPLRRGRLAGPAGRRGGHRRAEARPRRRDRRPAGAAPAGAGVPGGHRGRRRGRRARRGRPAERVRRRAAGEGAGR